MNRRLLLPSLLFTIISATAPQTVAAETSQRFLVVVGSSGFGHICITTAGKARGLLRIDGKPTSFAASIEDGRFSVSARAGGGKRFRCEFALSNELAVVSSTLDGEAIGVSTQAHLGGSGLFGVGQLPVSVSLRSATAKNTLEGSLTSTGKFLSANSTRVALNAKYDEKTGIVSGKFGSSALIGIVTGELLTARCDNGTRISIRATGAPVISVPQLKSRGTAPLVKSGAISIRGGSLQTPPVDLSSNLSPSQPITSGGFEPNMGETLHVASQPTHEGAPFGSTLQVGTNYGNDFTNPAIGTLTIANDSIELPAIISAPVGAFDLGNGTSSFEAASGTLNVTKGTSSANGWISIGNDVPNGSIGYVAHGNDDAIAGWSGSSTAVVNVTSGGSLAYNWWTPVNSAPQDLNIPSGVLGYKDASGQLVTQPSSTVPPAGTVLLAEGDTIVVGGRTYVIRYAQ